MIRVLFVPYIPGRPGIPKRENRAYLGARYTPACTLLASARDMALNRCVLLLLMHVAPVAAAVVLGLRLRFLLRLPLQLLRGCDKKKTGDSRLGDTFLRNKQDQQLVKVYPNL